MRYSITILLFFILKISISGNIPLLKARESAKFYYSEKWKALDNTNVFEKEIVFYVDNSPAIYLFNVKGENGFILLSAESSLPELLGYSLTGNYSENNSPEAFNNLITQYQNEIRYYKNTLKLQSQSNKTDKLNSLKKSNNIVTPLITSKWDQSCFYNDSCPAAPTAGAYYCQRVPAGCVAICLSQIIKYHQFPTTGIGTNTYYTPYYGMLHANFVNTTYNYTAMPDILFYQNPSAAQLIYHCGVAVNMDYKPLYSGAGIVEARNALVNYFNYANSTQVIQKSSYTDAAWKSLIKSELDSARPVFYSGYNQNNSGGHAFICDGYQANDYFHINWGWGGQFDGYFLLNILNPNSNNFSYNQSAIIGIKPQNNFPVAHFTANQTLINSGGNVNFTDISSGNPTSWNWIFSGGIPSVSNLKHPQNIVYSTSGVYPVTLSVSNSNGSNTITKNAYITVAPIADFKSNKTKIATGESISFTDNSTLISQPTSRIWTFNGGNPSTSTLANPSNITYLQPGTYKVSLTINTPEGNHTCIKNNYITVYANCNYQFKDSIPKYYINPSNASAFQIYQEDFDSLTPYYAGHNTKWNVFNKVISPGDTNFFYGATSLFTQAGQANNWLEFGPVSIPQNGAVFKWDHLYYLNTKRDGYEVLLSTSGITRSFYTAPPVFSRADNDALTNNDTVWTSQEVNIDGSIYGGQQIYIAFHHFANNKYYLFLDNLKIVSCNGLPVHADFIADSTTINLGSSVNFTDNSTGNPVSWKWYFYGAYPPTSMLQNPTGIVYNTPGFHSVKLVVNNGEQSDSIIKTNYIYTDNTGISVAQKKEDVKLYPNPVINDLIIQMPSEIKGKVNIRFFDLLGNLLKEISFIKEENLVTIPLNQFCNGIYIVEINAKNYSLFKKIIKSE